MYEQDVLTLLRPQILKRIQHNNVASCLKKKNIINIVMRYFRIYEGKNGSFLKFCTIGEENQVDAIVRVAAKRITRLGVLK